MILGQCPHLFKGSLRVEVLVARLFPVSELYSFVAGEDQFSGKGLSGGLLISPFRQ